MFVMVSASDIKSILIIDFKQFQGKFPVILFLLNPTLNEFQLIVKIVVLLPYLRVFFRDFIDLLDVAALYTVGYI